MTVNNTVAAIKLSTFALSSYFTCIEIDERRTFRGRFSGVHSTGHFVEGYYSAERFCYYLYAKKKTNFIAKLSDGISSRRIG